MPSGQAENARGGHQRASRPGQPARA
jgi:hypothetical protein